MHIVSLLSLVWFGLCAKLVTREADLIIVFFSFLLSFSLAYLFTGVESLMIILSTSSKLPRKKEKGLVVPFNKAMIKNTVAILVCFVVLCLVIQCEEATHFENFISSRRFSTQYYCLGIIAGYLVFELWYDRMYCASNPTPIISLMESAATLTLLCIILYRWRESFALSKTIHYQYSTSNVSIHVNNSHILLWLFYKICRCVWDIFGINFTITHEKIGSMENPVHKAIPSHVDPPLWLIHGNRYDLSGFVERHPGGKEAILLGRGRDCTAMFESYHPFTNRHRIILEKFKLNTSGTVANTQQEDSDPFYDALKSRVSQRLLECGINPEEDRCATWGRCAYYSVILVFLIISAYYHVKANILGSFSFALFGWLVGALGHDAGHFAASRKPILNDIAVWAMSLLCNPIMWQHQHTYAHHSHTNDSLHDPDLHHFDILLRVHRRCKYKGLYKHQTNLLWVILAYSLVVFGTCIKIPLSVMTTGFIYGMVENTDRKRRFRAFSMLVHYVAYLGIIVIAPFFSGKSWGICSSCVLIHLGVAGLLFAFFSQINHLNEQSLENKQITDGKVPQSSWAVNQVITSNNFAMDSIFWHYFSNGLNMQIEHHLFPGLNHCHLHLVAPIVKATCDEYRVPYKSYDSWTDIMKATLRWLDVLSTDDTK